MTRVLLIGGKSLRLLQNCVDAAALGSSDVTNIVLFIVHCNIEYCGAPCDGAEAAPRKMQSELLSGAPKDRAVAKANPML
jgi:hypothetical protein